MNYRRLPRHRHVPAPPGAVTNLPENGQEQERNLKLQLRSLKVEAEIEAITKALSRNQVEPQAGRATPEYQLSRIALQDSPARNYPETSGTMMPQFRDHKKV